VTRLKKLVFRATKGLAWVSVKDIAPQAHNHLGKEIHKSVFIILYQENETFTRKLKLICDNFGSKNMEINTDDLNQKIESVSREIESMSLIERQSRQELDNSYHHLNTIEGVDISLVEFAKWLIMKEK